MPTLIELASQIVTAQTTTAAMSTEEIISSLTRIHETMIQLESVKAGGPVMQPGSGRILDVVVQPKSGRSSRSTGDKIAPDVAVNEAFRDKEIICLICNKPFQRLGVHLTRIHGMRAVEYRARFGIPKNRPLLSNSLLEVLKGQANNFGSKSTSNSKAAVVAPKDSKRQGRPRKVLEL